MNLKIGTRRLGSGEYLFIFPDLTWLWRDGHAGIILTFSATSAANIRCQCTEGASQTL